MICFRGETGVCGGVESASLFLVNFLTLRFKTSPLLLSPQLSVSDKKYQAAGGMMRLSPHSAAGSGGFAGTVSFGFAALDCHLQGPSHLGSTLLAAIYRVCVKWVCSAVVHLQGPCHLSFFWKKSEKCAALY